MNEIDNDKEKFALTEHKLPIVSEETLEALYRDITSGEHSVAEWVAIVEKEQPNLIIRMKNLASAYGEKAPEVFRELVIVYMAIRKQAKANKMSATFGAQS